MLPPYHHHLQTQCYTMYEEIASQNHLHCVSLGLIHLRTKLRGDRIATKTNGETFSDKHRDVPRSQIVIMIGSRGTLIPQMQLHGLGFDRTAHHMIPPLQNILQ